MTPFFTPFEEPTLCPMMLSPESPIISPKRTTILDVPISMAAMTLDWLILETKLTRIIQLKVDTRAKSTL